jgi:hypothetical protein
VRLNQCPRCRGLFVKGESPVCRGCEEAEIADYCLIREALAQDGDAAINEVAETAGVDVAVVLRMLEKGLISNDGDGHKIPCERCGQPSVSRIKQLCPRCLIDYDQNLSGAINEALNLRSVFRGATVNEVHKHVLQKRHNH